MLLLLAVIFLSISMVLWQGVLLTWFWSRYISPVFSLRRITLPEAIGFQIIIALFDPINLSGRIVIGTWADLAQVVFEYLMWVAFVLLLFVVERAVARLAAWFGRGDDH